MKHLRLTLIATACALAITACSTGNKPRSIPEQKKAETTTTQTTSSETAKKTEEEVKDTTSSTNSTTSTNQTTDQTSSTQDDSEKQKEIDALKEQVAALESEKQKALEAEQAAKKAEEEAKKAAEDAKRAEEEAKLSDAQRVTFNQGEVKKGFGDNGTDNEGISYVSGGALVVNGNKLTYQPVEAQSQKIDQLVVDGKAVELFSAAAVEKRQESYQHNTYNLDPIMAEGLTGKMGSLPKSRTDNGFAQMRFGYATNAEGKTTLFVQGIETPTNSDVKSSFNYYYATSQPDKTETLRPLETQGRFEYLGSAFYGKDNQYAEYAVNGIADMDNKKVKVNMTEGDKVKLTLGGAIDGNHFAGNYQGVEMKGAFYGTRGQDIGGLFYQTQGDEKDFTGVFGATQKDCGWRGCDQPQETLADFEVK